MRGLYILSEGSTEEEFVNSCLRPYFNDFGIYDVRAILMETSPGYKGGDISYQRYKRNAEILLKRESDIVVTSIIDFFRLKPDFPCYEESKLIPDKMQRVEFLEHAISHDISHKRFLPYIQLHEFEGLLFSDTRGFDYLPHIPKMNLIKLHRAVEECGNPELLNDGDETAPSKRLIKLIPGYSKALYGPIIADEVGIKNIKSRCIRFNRWLEFVLNKMKM